jgi:hypothetical protein
MRRGLVAITLTPVALALVLLSPARATAQDKQTAEALFEEGQRLFDAKDYPRACEKFAASQRMDPAVGTLLNLGRCYEAGGRIASAAQAFADAAAQAHRENDTKREKFAAQKESELKAQVPRLTITVAGASVPGLVVERDGKALDPAVFGVAIPLDPGAHTIKATAPKKEPFATTVTLRASEALHILEIPALKDAAPVAPPPPERKPALETPPPAPPGPGLGTQRTIAIALGGAGVVALGIGAYFGLHASSLQSDAKPHCFGDGTCDADGVSLTDRAGSSADVSTILFVAGGALLAGGAALWFTAAPSKNASTTGAGPSLQIGVAGPAGVLRVAY